MSKVNPQHWQQVKGVFESALERPDNERAEFLDRVCAGDAALRKEVESLLQSYQEAGSFMEAPAVASAAESLVGEQNKLVVGQRVKHYEILAAIGEGGMGEVYLAKDTVLGRRVALKLLPEYVSNDSDRLRRFKQEARTASTLSHPNVCVIHEVGETDDRPFIAMEYIEGITLRQRMNERAMKLGDVLDIAIQVGDALTAAHEAGVVHRDIKPENLMIRRDGYVKVLDFGLAKLTERRQVSASATMSTLLVHSSPGTVMGTAAYMSPEQARGVAVDERTDIWSLGVVLYEMVARHAPFAGATPSDMLVSVMEREPQPLAHESSDLPAELERIVRKALQKDPEERYQVVKDLALDLKSLRRQLDAEAERERSMPPELSGEAEAQGGIEQAAVETGQARAKRTGELGAARPTTSADYLVTEIKRHKKAAIVTLAALVVAVAGIALGYYLFIINPRSTNKLAAFLQNMQVTQLTTNGKSLDAVISPDGKYVAYVMADGEKQSLWVRQVATSSTVLVVPPAEISYQGLVFSHDGNYVYYNMWDRKSVGVIYQVPVLGGAPPRRIIVDTMPGVAVSPDSKQIAFIRGYAKENESHLLLANTDGTGEKKLAVRKSPDACWGPAWSPDGKIIAFAVWNDSGKYVNVVEVPADGGSERQITSQSWVDVGQISWLGDGSGLIMAAANQRRSPPQIWYLSYAEGEARKITNDLNGYGNLSLTEDSSTLVTVRGNGLSNIWLTANGEASRQISSGNTEGTFGLSWTPDGKIVYASTASGNLDLWIMQPDGSGKKQLTFDAQANRLPSVSPDGRYIVFVSDRTGTDNIWRMNMDGSNPKQLTRVDGDSSPYCSPDGRWVVYKSWPSGKESKESVWKVPIDGGNPVQVTNTQTPLPSISPDGKLIASPYWDEQSNPQQWRIAIISFSDGQIVKTLGVPSTAVGSTGRTILLRWTADGQALTYIDNRGGFSNIWSQPLDGGPSKQLTDFKADRIFWFDWSRDGKQLACARGTGTSDVFLIKGFK